MALIAAHLNAEVILVVTVSVAIGIHIISLSPHLHTPFPPFSPSLISLTVSVDVKHHVYFYLASPRLETLISLGSALRFVVIYLLLPGRGLFITTSFVLFSTAFSQLHPRHITMLLGSVLSYYIKCLAQIADPRAQELCESRGGRPGLPSLINLRFLWT